MRGRTLLHDSDDTLLTLIAAGDERALGELYDRFGRVAYGLALRIVGDPGLAEEAVQDAFLSVWRSAGRFDSTQGKSRSWLLTIVHRRAVDLVQRAARRPEVAAAEVPERPTATTEETAGSREEQRVVLRALERLPFVQRQALELAYYGGFSQTQISRHLGVPLGTVKTRIFHGLRRLGALVTDNTANLHSSESARHQLAAAQDIHPKREPASFTLAGAHKPQ